LRGLREMRAEGLEPPRPLGHRLLRPACLPVPPRPRGRPASVAVPHTWAAPGGNLSCEMATAASKERRPGVIITHPNRNKAVVQATRATVVILFLASAGLVLIVTVGGWSLLSGLVPVQLAYVLIYVTMAFFAARWNRGVLPVGAALAVLLAI